MTLSLWTGAVTPTGWKATARTSAASARLAISGSADMTNPTYTAALSPTGGVATFTVTGRVADTDYWCALEEDGTLDTFTAAHVHTFPTAGSQASFRVTVGSCAGATTSQYLHSTAVSNAPIFDTIKATEPLLFCHLGDMHYRNITANDPQAYRDAYDAVLAAPRQAELYRSTPIAYMWDDHDYSNNDSDGTAASRPAASAVYRERVPSYTVPAGPDAPIYQSWEIGRVLFILSDTRHDRTPSSQPDSPSKTMLGATQKTWMRGVLEGSSAELLVWLNPTPWMGFSADTWAGYATERDELAQMFADTGWADRMVCINGDYHGLGMDTGGGNAWGGFPVYLWCSMDSPTTGTPTSQYDMGPTSIGAERYGTLDVTDTGDYLQVTGTGYIADSIWRQHTFYVTTTVEASPPRATTLTYDDTLARVRITSTDTSPHPYEQLIDTFDRTVSYAWGTATSGQQWQVSGGNDGQTARTDTFETDTTGWEAVGGALALATDHAHGGAQAATLTPTGAAATPYIGVAAASAVAAKQGLGYVWSAWVYATAGYSGVTPSLAWLDGTGALVGTETGTTTAIPAGVWTRLTVSGFAAANTAGVAPRLTMSGTPAAGDVLYVDDATLNHGGTDYGVAGNVGQVGHSTVGDRRFTRTGSYVDVELVGQVRCPVTPTGANIVAGLVARSPDDNNGVHAWLAFSTTGAMTLNLYRRVAGTFASIGTYSLTGTLNTAVPMWIKLNVTGATASAKAWATTADEPGSWQVTGAVDTSLTSGPVGTHSTLLAGNTNGTVTLEFDGIKTSEPPHTYLDVERSTNQITWAAVRGGAGIDTAPGQTISVSDYEFTPDVPNYYRVTVRDLPLVGDVLDRSIGVTTPTMTSVWLKSASRPFLNRAVAVVDMGAVTRAARGATFDVIGRSLPVAVTGVRGARSFDLTVLVDGATQADALAALLSLGEPVLVHVPQACPLPIPTMYAMVGDTSDTAPSRYSTVHTVTLPLTEVAPPGPDVIGATVTWASIANDYATWADLAADQATWGDVLNLIGDPADVVIA